ncbi:uncharacterized protein BT62DRAFT_1008415 [Guyanagaster necrorhizus]|uniref:Uncharacterized protein n=1 Tax=Guyanagaster necrorhizus TaxID=856835 RepID=A0A9P7VN25_9AGAR|nr:uncharacterized protein BT62DRAFT_1008415 [Guyanagaster necrorhizus MCA 3950]KAG7444211.1 hypothetical protein BT62DRAFT_1008415 [Guyanagaster necrorhizus MCA 3950]
MSGQSKTDKNGWITGNILSKHPERSEIHPARPAYAERLTHVSIFNYPFHYVEGKICRNLVIDYNPEYPGSHRGPPCGSNLTRRSRVIILSFRVTRRNSFYSGELTQSNSGSRPSVACYKQTDSESETLQKRINIFFNSHCLSSPQTRQQVVFACDTWVSIQ